MESRPIVLLCERATLHYFQEYLNSLLATAQQLQIPMELRLYSGDCYEDLVLGGYNGRLTLNLQDINVIVWDRENVPLNPVNAPPGLVFLNTEQATRPNVQERFQKLGTRKLLDYSLHNIRIARGLGVNCRYIPYQYFPAEQQLLRSLIQTCPKLFDVVFVGHPSPRRLKVLETLQLQGVTVLNLSSVWGQQRDVQISQARILLNIHYDEVYGVYEAIRCDRWLLSGMPVVSEIAIQETTLQDIALQETTAELPESVKGTASSLATFVPYSELVGTVKLVLAGYPAYLAQLIVRRDELEASIRANNERHFQDAVAYLRDIEEENV